MCSRIGTIVKKQAGKLTAIKLSCRSWSCETCRGDRAKGLIMEVREGTPQRFITLTVNPEWFNTPEERARRLVAAWRLIRRRFLAERPNAVVEFMAVFERTKNGEPHLHIAQRGSFMPQKWLSNQMHKILGAKVVDIRYIRDQKRIAYYVAKYVGKEPFQFGTLKRYWRSAKYLAMSKAEARRIRNSGAVFYILDCHWKGYLKRCITLFGEAAIHLRRKGFALAFDDDDIPPWCLCTEPIICR